MMQKYMPFIAIMLINFYVLAIFIINTIIAVITLFIIMPIINFINSFVFVTKNKFNLMFPIITTLFFIRVILFYFNDSALIYIPIHCVVSLIGTYMGASIKSFHFNVIFSF